MTWRLRSLRESHLVPVPRQSHPRLIPPQQKTNLALAKGFDLHASHWCFHFHTIWIKLFKEITTFLLWFGVILLDYPTLKTPFFCWGKKKIHAPVGAPNRFDIKSISKRLTSYRTHPGYSPGRLLRVWPLESLSYATLEKVKASGSLPCRIRHQGSLS